MTDATNARGGEGPVAWLTTGGDVTRSHAYAVEQSVNDPANYPVALYARPALQVEAGVRDLVSRLVAELAPDQGQSASDAFGLALRLQTALSPAEGG